MLVVLTGSNRNSKFDLVANARGTKIGSARSRWRIGGEKQQLHIILWCSDARTTKGSFVPFFQESVASVAAGLFRGSARASGVVAVDHHAIKAWRVIVRKAEQFIPELLWSSAPNHPLMRGVHVDARYQRAYRLNCE
jgi:hypothetical protein